MKKILYLILAIAISSFTFIGCISDEDALSTNDIEEAINRGRNLKRESSVTFQDVKALVNSLQKGEKTETRATGEEKFVFIIDDENDTLFYVVNHLVGGWTMYASDKRVPAVVAYNEKGTFEMESAMKVMGEWMETMKDDMKAVKKAEDKDLNFTAEEIEANKNTWNAVCDPDGFIVKRLEQARGHGEPIDPPIYPGHYELVGTEIYTEIYDSVNHLTSTMWHQHDPYNMYCPYKSSGTDRAPAGCVAIAGAQMLYYLHDKLGVPEQIPDSAYCYGNINSYSWGQLCLGRDVWSKLAHDGNDGFYCYDFNGNYVKEATLIAPLVANVAFLVDMDFGNDGSGADTEDLVDNVFNYYGIQCQYGSFNTSIVYNSLLQNMPVVASAKRNLTEGHAFIIDGYKREHQVTTYYYEWVYDVSDSIMLSQPLPFVPNKETTIYSTPYISYIKMNWGWGYDYYYNSMWQIPTGDWIAGKHNYDRKRKIIYGFHATE